MYRSRGAESVIHNGACEPARSASCPLVELLTVQLLEQLRLAVVFGGDKRLDGAVIRQSASPRSWKSYENVACDIAAAMRRLGCRHIQLLPDDMRLAQRLKNERLNFAWLNTGGVQGRNAISHASATLEMLGLPYVGHDPLTAAALDNKFFFKRQLRAIGLPTTPFLAWHPVTGHPDPTQDRRFTEVFDGWHNGFIVKPITGRASLHVHFVERATDIARVARHVFDVTQNDVLIEAYLPGREFCIAVIGSTIARGGKLERLSAPFAFAAVERMLEHGEHVFTSMDKRPITRERVRALDRRHDAFVLDALEDLASTLYTEFPLKTLVRLDVRADDRDKLFVLEANPKPDLKAPEGASTSLICAGLDHCGMSYDDLILSIFANRAAELLDDAAGIAASLDQLIDL